MSDNIIQYVNAAANGDTDAMAKLFSRTLKASYFLASTLTDDSVAALEITKKAYAMAFCTIDKLKKPEAFEIWMKQNVALVYKKGVKFVFADADAGAVENSSEFLSEEIYNSEEASAKILEAISLLRPELRAAIVLHYNNGMPVNVLAKFFGVSESTANALLGKARATILSGVELNAETENGSLPVLTRILQRAASDVSIGNSDVRDIFIYAIDSYEASKPAEPVEEESAPVQEETPAAEVSEEPVSEESEQVAVEEAPAEEIVAEDEPQVPEFVPAVEENKVVSFQQRINEILDGNASPVQEVAEEVSEPEVDEIDVPAFVSEESVQEAVDNFSNYDNYSKTETSKAKTKKKLNINFGAIKRNPKLLGIIGACVVVLIVICVAVSNIGKDKPETPSGGSNVVDTLGAGYDWRAGGFAECTEIIYLDENCLSFKSVSTGKYGLLDYQGNVILQPNYDGFRHCRTGRDYSESGIYHSLVVIGTQEYQITVTNGNVVISDTPHLDHTLNNDALSGKSYDERDRYFEGYAAARKDDKWGYVSQERDKKVIPYEYEAVNEYASALDYAGSDYCRPVTDGHIAVKKNGMMGIINLENEIVVPFEYSNIMPGENGVYIACKGGTWGVILVGDAVSSFAGVNISVDPLSPGNTTEDITSSTTTYDSYTVISDTGANVRDGAGAEFEKIGELEYGDTVRAYDTKRADNGNKWVKIRYNGQYGWVAMSNLEEEGV